MKLGYGMLQPELSVSLFSKEKYGVRLCDSRIILLVYIL